MAARRWYEVQRQKCTSTVYRLTRPICRIPGVFRVATKHVEGELGLRFVTGDFDWDLRSSFACLLQKGRGGLQQNRQPWRGHHMRERGVGEDLPIERELVTVKAVRPFK